MKVYLIRHAQSEENVLDLKLQMTARSYNELLQRSHDVPLTLEGERQAQELIARLREARITHLYSSPFLRALRTATVLGDSLGLQPQILDDLREVLPPPRDEGLGTASLRRHFVQSYLRLLWPWGTHAGPETITTAYRRAKAVWATITAQPAAEVAAVAHRGLLSLMLIAVQRERRWRILTRDLSNGGISIIVPV